MKREREMKKWQESLQKKQQNKPESRKPEIRQNPRKEE